MVARDFGKPPAMWKLLFYQMGVGNSSVRDFPLPTLRERLLARKLHSTVTSELVTVAQRAIDFSK